MSYHQHLAAHSQSINILLTHTLHSHEKTNNFKVILLSLRARPAMGNDLLGEVPIAISTDFMPEENFE